MDVNNAGLRSSQKRKRNASASSSPFCFSCCFHKRDISTSNTDAASENHLRHHHCDRPQPKLLRTSSAWLKAKITDLPEIRDRYKSIVSKLGQTQRRRHASDFSYDAFSYALNFDDDSRADEFPPRSFSARLPPTEKANSDVADDDVGVVSSPRPIGEVNAFKFQIGN